MSSGLRTLYLRHHRLPKKYLVMRKLAYLLICVLTACWACSVHAQSTIFNYQGRLDVNGNPANGLYDFQFTIYKIETDGIIIAGPMTNTAVAVSNGLFNLSADKDAIFAEIQRVLKPGGRTVNAEIVLRTEPTSAERDSQEDWFTSAGSLAGSFLAYSSTAWAGCRRRRSTPLGSGR